MPSLRDPSVLAVRTLPSNGLPRTTRPRLAAARGLLALFAATLVVSGCGSGSPQQCLALPCALPVAISVQVVDARTGAPIPDARVQVSGAATAIVSCSSACFVPGTAGRYRLLAEAQGYQAKEASVSVPGESPPCGCPSVIQQSITMALSPELNRALAVVP